MLSSTGKSLEKKQPVLSQDERLFAIETVRVKNLNEKHCREILGQLIRHHGRVELGTMEEQQAARQWLAENLQNGGG